MRGGGGAHGRENTDRHGPTRAPFAVMRNPPKPLTSVRERSSRFGAADQRPEFRAVVGASREVFHNQAPEVRLVEASEGIKSVGQFQEMRFQLVPQPRRDRHAEAAFHLM